jgi:hypothetical protein
LNLNLPDLLGTDTFKCTLDCSEKPTNFPNFYWLMMRAWFEMKKITNKVNTSIDVRREFLWLNKNIKINRKQIKWKLWFENGIRQIHDIVDKNGEFLTAKKLKKSML